MRNKQFYNRQHIFILSRKIKLSAVLLLVTLLQQIILSIQGMITPNISLSLGTVWSAAAVTYSVLSYRNNLHRITDDGIKIRLGIFFSKTFTIPFRNILTLTFRQSIFQRLAGAVDVISDTPARFTRFGDMSLCLKIRSALAVKKILSAPKGKLYRCDSVRILLMSAFRSNPASGLLILAPVVYRLGNISGFTLRRIRKMLAIPMTAKEISDTAELAAQIMVLCWSVSLVVRFLGYSNFSSHSQGEFIVSSRGFFTRILSFSRRSAISAVVLDSTLLMHLFGLCSVSLFTIGSEKKSADKNMILPSDTKSSAHHMLHDLFSIRGKEKIVSRPKKIFSYIRMPLCFLGADSIFLLYIYHRFGISACTILSLSVPPILWWILFRYAAYRESHIGICENCFCVCTFSKMTLRHYYIPFEKIQKFRITQNFFQKKSGTCNFCIYVYSEKKICIKVRQLPKDFVKNMAATQL